MRGRGGGIVGHQGNCRVFHWCGCLICKETGQIIALLAGHQTNSPVERSRKIGEHNMNTGLRAGILSIDYRLLTRGCRDAPTTPHHGFNLAHRLVEVGTAAFVGARCADGALEFVHSHHT